MEKIIFLLAVKPLHSVCGGGDILQQLLNQHFFFHLDGWILSQRNDILRLNHIQNKLNFSCWKRNNSLATYFLIKGKWQIWFLRLIVTRESPAWVQAGNDRLLIEERLFKITMFSKDTFFRQTISGWLIVAARIFYFQTGVRESLFLFLSLGQRLWWQPRSSISFRLTDCTPQPTLSYTFLSTQ